MYKNQLQELAQRSCFNLPCYACIREGPDHAPRFKASVNFNGEIFEGPSYSTTLRQAEHAAAEVALNTLTSRGPSRSITARVLDETGVYKNLLQETAHRAGLNLPVYTTLRSGPGHVPVFTCTVELAGMNFNGESAKTKKQAEKNAALAAWSALKRMPNLGCSSLLETSKEIRSSTDEQEQVVVTRVLSNFKPKDERKSVRQRDKNQARGVVNSLQYRQWGSMNLLSDFSSMHPTHQQNQQQNRVMAVSKSLTSSRDINSSLYSSNKPTPLPISRSQVKIQEIPSPMEEKSMEKEPKNSNSSSGSRPEHTYRPFPIPNNTKLYDPVHDQQTQIGCSSFRYPTPSSMVSAAASLSLPRILHTGGFQAHMAPAVHLRSAIPVYAGAPPPLGMRRSSTPLVQEASSSTSSRVSDSTQTGDNLSSFSSKLT